MNIQRTPQAAKSKALGNRQASLGSTLGSIPGQIGALFSLPGQQAKSAQAAQDARSMFARAQGAGAQRQSFASSFPSQNALQASQGDDPIGYPIELPPPPITVEPPDEPPVEPPFPGPGPGPGPRYGNQRLQETNPVGGVRSFKKGGKVEKTGLAYLHKGERVITAKSEALRSKLKHKK